MRHPCPRHSTCHGNPVPPARSTVPVPPAYRWVLFGPECLLLQNLDQNKIGAQKVRCVPTELLIQPCSRRDKVDPGTSRGNSTWAPRVGRAPHGSVMARWLDVEGLDLATDDAPHLGPGNALCAIPCFPAALHPASVEQRWRIRRLESGVGKVCYIPSLCEWGAGASRWFNASPSFGHRASFYNQINVYYVI